MMMILTMNLKSVFWKNVLREGGGGCGKWSRGSWTQPIIRGLCAMSNIHQSFFTRGKFDGDLSKSPAPDSGGPSSRTRLQRSGKGPSAHIMYAVKVRWDAVVEPMTYVKMVGLVTSVVR